jgi:hypothetical protein
MGVIIIVLVAIFAISESNQINLSDAIATHEANFVTIDEGDIGQIFGTHSYKSESVQVTVEEPVVQAQVSCYQASELVRDLTVPYGQRSYIQSDGTACTPVE